MNSDHKIPLNALLYTFLNSHSTGKELVAEHESHNYCKAVFVQVCQTNTEFRLHDRGHLIRKSIFNDAIRLVVSEFVRIRILHLAYFPSLAGHFSKQETYDRMQRHYDWPHMSHSVYTTVPKCESCVRNGNQYSYRRKIKLSPASCALGIVARDILKQLPMKTIGNKCVLVITDRYSKLTRSIPSYKTVPAHIANLFSDHWIILFGILTYLLMDIELQFFIEFFSSITYISNWNISQPLPTTQK